MKYGPVLQTRIEKASETVIAASKLLDERTGIIKHVYDLMIEPDDPRLFHAVADVTNTSRLYGCQHRGEQGGTGLTREMAQASAIGEAIERLCCAIYDPHYFLLSSYNSLRTRGIKAAPPSSFALYSRRQYEQRGFVYRPFSEDSEVSWTKGCSLVSGEPIWVPACLVYLPYKYEHRGDLIGDGISTGLCCARSLREAMLGGLYEVVERDAIMVMWMNKLRCPQLNLESSEWLSAIISERFSPSGLELHLNEITTDIPISVIFASLVDRNNEGLAVSVGASSNLDSNAAALKALLEAAQGRLWLKFLKQKGPRKFRADFSDIVSFEDHVGLYGSLERIPNLDFLFNSLSQSTPSSSRPFQATDATPDLEQCVTSIAALGLDVISVDVTQPDVEGLGFHVAKILIPGLTDINAHHQYPRLGGNRLYTVPHIMRYLDQETREEELNRIPHPFP